MTREIVSLFTGYGGLDLGLERAGVGVTTVQAEIDPYCREIEARHWPHARRFNDVREVTGVSVSVRGGVLCGGFPCQPVSVAGKRRAQADIRWLWPEFARITEEIAPAIIVAENVPGLRTAGLRDVLADLARLGFDAEWTCFRAWDFGAPHERNRFWLVATHPDRVVVRDEPGWLGRAIERLASTVGRGVGADGVTTDADGRVERGPLQEREHEATDDRESSEAAHAAGEPIARVAPESPTRGLRDTRRDRREVTSAASADALRRLEQARLVAIQRGWAERCGWTLDPAPRVDDGPAAGLARGGRERARKAAGNGVVVACAQAVGEAIVSALGWQREVSAA